MNARRRHSSRSTEQGVYLGPSHTQALPPRPPAASAPPEPLIHDIMSCRDRTNEFMSACKSLQGRQNGVPLNKPSLTAVKQRSDFTLMAKKSLFDDKAVEIEELTYIIKQDINSLNKQIAQLQDLSKLASMSNDFKSVLEVRTEVSVIVPAAKSTACSSVLMQDESQSSGAVSIEMDSRASQQLQLIDEQCEEARAESLSLQRELKSLSQSCVSVEELKERLSHELQARGAQVCSLEGQLGASRKQIESLQQELKHVLAELEKLQNSQHSGESQGFFTPTWNHSGFNTLTRDQGALHSSVSELQSWVRSQEEELQSHSLTVRQSQSQLESLRAELAARELTLTKNQDQLTRQNTLTQQTQDKVGEPTAKLLPASPGLF
ncbi:UNVERIFIED_CONTAM: hypothetical protein FKN15_004477 [Acipenser sinensis]